MQDRLKFRLFVTKNEAYPYKVGYVNPELFCIHPDGEESFFSADYDFAECVVEQCTGLRDKNGKLIYEGDILKCVHSDIMKYKIYWGRSCWRMKVYGTNNEIVDDTHLFLDTDILEVIGNIHENLELLENE